MRRETLRADALMLVAALIWGTGFVAQRLGMDHVGPMTFTAARFTLGALVVLPLVLVRRRRAAHPRRLPLAGGLAAGVALFGGAALQQIGLVTTSAAKAGFITGLYVLIVPLLGLISGHRVARSMWAAAALAVAGLYLLSVSGGASFSRGDGFVLACAVLWAVHVLIVARVAPSQDPFELAVVQFTVVALLASVAAGLYRDYREQRDVGCRGGYRLRRRALGWRRVHHSSGRPAARLGRARCGAAQHGVGVCCARWRLAPGRVTGATGNCLVAP